MNKKSIALVMTLGLFAAAAAAQEQGTTTASGLSTWLKGLSKKIERVVTRKAPPVSTAVAGVRGAKQDGKGRLYWKGKAGEEAVTEEELAAFKAALDLAERGDQAAAVNELEKFMSRYPDSTLIPDAAKTVSLVKAEGQEAKPAP
jgi:TolA-binding protein